MLMQQVDILLILLNILPQYGKKNILLTVFPHGAKAAKHTALLKKLLNLRLL